MDKIIFCFINGGSPGAYQVCALGEDGVFASSHLSSSEGYAKYDIGITSERKHDIYKKLYPDGYKLEWIEPNDEKKCNSESLAKFKKALELNQANSD